MEEQNELITLTVDVVSSFVGQNNIRPDDVPAFIASVHQALGALGTPVTAPEAETPAQEEFTPAVTARKSLANPDFILSMVDGKPYKTLRRHLSTNGLTPEEYRARYGLKADYPMVAPTYSEARKAMAIKIGLGNKRDAPVSDVTPVEEAPKAKRGRKPKALGDALGEARNHLKG